MNSTFQPSRFPSIQLRQPIERRAFLKGVGVGLALPFLEAMLPPLARAAAAERPRRMVLICNNLGVVPQYFFPKDAGANYTLSPYLEIIKEHRQEFTVFSGVAHPGVLGGHMAQPSFLTAAPGSHLASYKNTISLDQFVAEQIGFATRFPSLALGVNVGGGSSVSAISFTSTGVAIPPQEKPSEVFKELFLQGSQAEMEAQMRRLKKGQSILDAVTEQAKRMQPRISAKDCERMEQYFSSVRDLEKRFQASQDWSMKPKPKVNAQPPKDVTDKAEFSKKSQLMYDLTRLSLETDSTRIVTVLLDAISTPPPVVDGEQMADGYHNLSHHGKSPELLSVLRKVEEGNMRALGQFIGDLKSAKEGDGNLLDHTMVFFGANLGDPSTHRCDNLPALLAGGGFKHGQHLAFDTQNNYPLPNLYVSMLQRMGIEKDRFATSTGTMKGLEVRS